MTAEEGRTICAICAWRENCKKRFNFESSGALRCPDYSRDVTIRDKEKKKEK
jgi:hypothetical protein